MKIGMLVRFSADGGWLKELRGKTGCVLCDDGLGGWIISIWHPYYVDHLTRTLRCDGLEVLDDQ